MALQKVKDAVDKAKGDLPNDLTQEPRVIEVNFSEQPIMYVNISGNYSSVQLKKYADDLKDKFDTVLGTITKKYEKIWQQGENLIAEEKEKFDMAKNEIKNANR